MFSLRRYNALGGVGDAAVGRVPGGWEAVQAATPRPIVPLTALGAADLPTAGGKGANLGELLRAGLPVPAGFVVTTAVYDAFVAGAGLDETITSATTALDGSDPVALAEAEATIAAAFDRAVLDATIAAAIGTAYEDLADGGTSPPAVAVRSSATAEDLPGASFAGQQETLLGVTGAAAVVAAVRQCWRSLWSGRAIAYRQQQDSAAADVTMAVVVQRMVEPAAAGVLFTADPVTSDRSRMIVEAVPGCGEALVQGSRTPDRYVVDHCSGHVREDLPAESGRRIAAGRRAGAGAPHARAARGGAFWSAARPGVGRRCGRHAMAPAGTTDYDP